MKNKFNIFFKTVAISSLSALVLIGTGFLYLEKKLAPAENKAESVPYYSQAPESKGVLFLIGNKGTLFHLDFEREILSVITEVDYESQTEIYGYPIDYTVICDYSLLAGIIDRLDGINLKTVEGEFRYTGAQIQEMFETTAVSSDFRDYILSEVFKRIATRGFSREDFLFIIENSETNLSVPDCFYWDVYMQQMCKNFRLII